MTVSNHILRKIPGVCSCFDTDMKHLPEFFLRRLLSFCPRLTTFAVEFPRVWSYLAYFSLQLCGNARTISALYETRLGWKFRLEYPLPKTGL